MATIIEIHGPNGSFVRRCDAACYNAKRPKCQCICKGANHGVGLEQALANTGGRPNQIPLHFLQEHPEVTSLVTGYHKRIHNAYTLDPPPPP